MKKIFKKMLKKIFLSNLFLNYKILIKLTNKGKNTLPKKYVDEVYEIFKGYDNSKEYYKKIILPYEFVDNINRNNINKPYEILDIIELEKKNKIDIFFETTCSCVLPVCILNAKGVAESSTYITLFFGGKTVELQLKYNNRFHYLPLDSEQKFDSVSIYCEQESLAIGKVILKDKEILPGKPKLVVQIFIDALTQCMLEKFSFEIMPNTKEFFSTGSTIYTNAYAQSEWTLSSMAGVFSGEYTNQHLIYHPRRDDKIADVTIPVILKNSGYTTFSCTNIPKLSPNNGFDKGFDRYILANDKDCNYVINEALEQLESINGNQYLFLGFFDIHESHQLQPISTQVSSKLESFQFKTLKGNSKNTKVELDSERIEVYKESIRHFDRKLKNLYKTISLYDENALVVLHSDHGVNFMGRTEELLSREREKVIFLYKNHKEQSFNNSIKEVRDLKGMLCEDLNVDNLYTKREKNICITESLFPNKAYEIAVRDSKNVLFYKVKWQDVISKNTKTYIPMISYHLLDDEQKKVDERDVSPKLEKTAKSHYLKLIENIDEKGISII